MHQRNDIDFMDLLHNLQFGQITSLQLELLLERSHISQTGIFEHGEAIRTFKTVKQVDDYNNYMTQSRRHITNFSL